MDNICEGCEVLTESRWGLCSDCRADAEEVRQLRDEENPEEYI